MKKIIIIVGGILVIIVSVTAVYLASGTSSTPSAIDNGNSFPGGDTLIPTPATGTGGEPQTITLQTFDKQQVVARNFFVDPAVGQYPTPGYFFLGYHTPFASTTDAMATTTPPYLIEYIASTTYFNIELLQEPIGETRVQAEQYLLGLLGISNADACRLDYMIAVPFWVNLAFSGENLGFSFCPGAVKLPN